MENYNERAGIQARCARSTRHTEREGPDGVENVSRGKKESAVQTKQHSTSSWRQLRCPSFGVAVAACHAFVACADPSHIDH